MNVAQLEQVVFVFCFVFLFGQMRKANSNPELIKINFRHSKRKNLRKRP